MFPKRTDSIAHPAGGFVTAWKKSRCRQRFEVEAGNFRPDAASNLFAMGSRFRRPPDFESNLPPPPAQKSALAVKWNFNFN